MCFLIIEIEWREMDGADVAQNSGQFVSAGLDWARSEKMGDLMLSTNG